MKWEKIASRENDFLKNYILYEALTEVFEKVLGIKYPDYLTIREGQKYTHYCDRDNVGILADFVLEKTKSALNFLEGVKINAEKTLNELINFSSGLPKLEILSNTQLSDLFQKYIHLYKQPYPYFLISVEAENLEGDGSEEALKAIDKMAEIRLFCRASFNKTHELILPLFQEIGRRFNTSADKIKFLTPKEIVELLSLDINEIAAKREKCVFVYINGKFQLFENAVMNFVGENEATVSSEIKGRGSYPGKFKGNVKLIKTIEDMNSLKGGEVIVLRMTTTDLITESLKRVGAIVTDEGGITCHAAILSREFKIPCIIGTKFATKMFKDGDLVEVDADNGVVKKVD